MTQTPIPPGIIHRVTQAARYVISGVSPETWFGPLQPLPPMAPDDVAGRRFDYPTGYNLTSLPRTSEPVTFEDLRALADNCDILRSVIKTRKDQMEALDWAIRVSPSLTGAIHSMPSDDQKQRIAKVTAFLLSPNREHGFSQWLRQILEDMFVIDAAILYKRYSANGELYALEIMDGATIKILLDDSGRLPLPPDPAYQQVLKGVPAVDYTREELLYLMHNPRSHKIYGYSHVEQVLVTVNILIRRALHQLEYYREGSQPDAFIGMPKEWNQEQIVTFQKHFDALLSGNIALRRHVRFMPGDFKYQETKAPPLKDAYDEFLARIVCYVFSISPEPFVGQVNRATAQTSHARAIDEGLNPLMRFVCGFMNRIIATEFASPDLEFVWQDAREQDPAEAAQIDVAYVSAGIMTVDEVRANMGLAPLTPVAGASALPTAVKKNLRKDDDDDDDEEDDDDDDDDDDGSDFDAAHPRWPAGTPGGIGGEFAPKDASVAAPDTHPASISIDDVRSAIVDGMTGTSRLPMGTDVAGDDSVPIIGAPKNIADALNEELGVTDPESQGNDALRQEEAITSQMLGVAIGANAEPVPPTTPAIEDLLMPDGQRLGQAGNSSDVRIIQGNIDDAQALFNQLTSGGKVIINPGYNGTMVELPNGATVGIRASSTNSPDTTATIDFGNLPSGINIRKVKFNP